MKESEFNREDLEFFVSKGGIKGLSKEYILEAVFDAGTQQKWYPKEGDIIVGCTGNIFIIGGVQHFHESIGGDVYFFGPTMAASRGCLMDTPVTSTMNRHGRFMKEGKPKEGEYNFSHCSWKEFRFVPYPHEVGRMSPEFLAISKSMMGL